MLKRPEHSTEPGYVSSTARHVSRMAFFARAPQKRRNPNCLDLSMPLEIAGREHEGIEILDLKGRLTFGEEDLQFREELEKLVRGQKTNVVVNVDGLHQIDSTGFGTLLLAQETLNESGGGLALAGLKPAHIEVLMKARLGVAFRTFENDLEAVNSFFPGREVHHFDVLEFVRSKQPQSVPNSASKPDA